MEFNTHPQSKLFLLLPFQFVTTLVEYHAISGRSKIIMNGSTGRRNEIQSLTTAIQLTVGIVIFSRSKYTLQHLHKKKSFEIYREVQPGRNRLLLVL
jgi:uncharacterized membrane protein YgdD (TMEM256/DUF423 family)